MNFPTHIFFMILIMVTDQLYWRKILCGCFHFISLWLLISIIKRCAEQCTLQLNHTSLNSGVVICLSRLWSVIFFSILLIFDLKSVFLTKFLTLGYFIFNSSKSTSSSWVSDIRYFTFNIIYFSIKSSFSS